MLVHVLDTATLESDRDPVSDLDIIEEELKQYGGLDNRPRIVVLNKIDVPDGKDLAEMVRPDLEARGYRVFEVSAVAHIGPEGAVLRPRRAGRQGACRQAEGGGDPDRHPPEGRRRRGLHRDAQEEDGLFRVRGEKPERWVRQTDFSNDEAVGYLADRLNRLGVEEELMKAGARSGDGVAIGPEDNAVVFDWEPTVMAGAEMLGRRGEDHRFEAPRPAAQRRRDRQAERDEAQQEYDDFEPF